jgi:hypothetical protein
VQPLHNLGHKLGRHLGGKPQRQRIKGFPTGATLEETPKRIMDKAGPSILLIPQHRYFIALKDRHLQRSLITCLFGTKTPLARSKRFEQKPSLSKHHQGP